MINQSNLIIVGFAILTGLALSFVLWGMPHGFHHGSQHQHPHEAELVDAPAGMHRMPDGSMVRNEGTDNGIHMMGGMDHSDMMVKSEREFLEGMIPHHQEAVDTAKEVVARGGSTPEIKKLAEDIIVAQEKEIADMKSWYQAWYGETYTEDADDYKPMMRDLENLSGATLDKVFLEDMVMHHMGAIMMAKSVAPYIEHQEITDLAKAIIETQTVEIRLMQQLLDTLLN